MFWTILDLGVGSRCELGVGSCELPQAEPPVRLKSSKIMAWRPRHAAAVAGRPANNAEVPSVSRSPWRGLRAAVAGSRLRRRPRRPQPPVPPGARGPGPGAAAGSGQPSAHAAATAAGSTRSAPRHGCRRRDPVLSVYQVGPCFEKQGGIVRRRRPDLPVLHADDQNVSVPSSNRWVPYDEKIEQIMLADFKRLWATNFLDDLAVETHDYKFSQRRHRQGRPLQHGGAPARQDRRLRRIEEGRAVEDRRRAEEAEHADRARLVHRPGPDPQGRRRRPRAVRREGLRVRRGEAGGQAGQRRDQDGEPDLPHHRRAEGEDPRRSTSRGTRRSPTAS